MVSNKTSDFNFHLPDALIAQHPSATRSASRLLHVDRASGQCRDGVFRDIAALLQPGDCLVFNNTRVVPARLHGNKASGGKIECLLERALSDNEALFHIKASKAPKAETLLHIDDAILKVIGRQGELFHCQCVQPHSLMALLHDHGHVPLPPYIERSDDDIDKERYQTVYAKHQGAVAAPTAGLHFDGDVFSTLQAHGVEQAYITLHVGAGTFQPVRVDNIAEHTMHNEYCVINDETVATIQQTKARGGRVIAVGTTTVRTLESAARSGQLQAYRGDTDIFITPGFEFNVIDGMITNFHLPESTLIMLVSAFLGYDHTMAAYDYAITQGMRFYSYGDAMLIL